MNTPVAHRVVAFCAIADWLCVAARSAAPRLWHCRQDRWASAPPSAFGQSCCRRQAFWRGRGRWDDVGNGADGSVQWSTVTMGVVHDICTSFRVRVQVGALPKIICTRVSSAVRASADGTASAAGPPSNGSAIAIARAMLQCVALSLFQCPRNTTHNTPRHATRVEDKPCAARHERLTAEDDGRVRPPSGTARKHHGPSKTWRARRRETRSGGGKGWVETGSLDIR
ncbi:hypothetical protein BJ912DRAFT_245301 [Pholiota molesta]|nr:hypothetical protein BJ912DRAFT_245301 [Pholiota molesta]